MGVTSLPSSHLVVTIANESHVIPLRWLRDIIAGRVEADAQTCQLLAAIILSMTDE